VSAFHQGIVSGLDVLRLKTFGGLSITGDHGSAGSVVTQRGGLALLVLLAAARERGLTRDKLLGYLWPERDEEHGRHALAQALHALRRDLHDDELFLGTTELRLNPARITSDVEEFETALAKNEPEQAVGLYAGPFLDGFYRGGAPEFERWVEAERARLKQQACQALETLATAAAGRDDRKASADWWRRLAALDPLNARIARALMGALAATGDRAGALRHARIHAVLLREEFDVAPDSAVTELARRLGDAPQEGAQIIAVGEATETASTDARPAGTPDSRRASRFGTWVAVGAVLTAVVASVLYRHFTTGPVLDPDLVAVAPFDVLAPNVDLWREGLVDVLSRNLDGAGPMRSVAPTVVIRRWRGRADPASAVELGRRTGARLVLVGALLGAGRDSVRLTATLVDVASGSALAEIAYHDATDHVDRLSDSLTLAVLHEIGRTRPIAAVRLASLGSTSLSAIKAFLRGEQFYRRGELDSALTAYQRAVALDSTFTLALRRLPLVLWARGLGQEPVLMLQEGAHNHGLAPRESLLVTVDSLWGALDAGEAEPSPLLQRLFATLDYAVRRYPDDPEVWYHKGELGLHWGTYAQPAITPGQALAAFERSIALDSTFVPACDHLITLALVVRTPADARRQVSACLALGPNEASVAALGLLDMLLDPTRSRSKEVGTMLDTLSADALSSAALIVLHWEDSAETQLRVTRAFTAARHGYRWADSSMTAWGLALALAYHGHLREAYTSLRLTGGMLPDLTFAELALLGGVPKDSAAATFGHWLRHGRFRSDLAGRWSGEVIEGGLGWWAETGDTGSIQGLTRRIDSWIGKAANPGRRALLRYAAAAAPAYLALARHDTADALSQFALVPDSLCTRCYLQRLTRIRLLALKGQNEEAARLLDERTHTLDEYLPSEISWALERARVNERLGNRDKAIQNYAVVARVWANADSSLQPVVAEARAALRRLGAEPRLATAIPR